MKMQNRQSLSHKTTNYVLYLQALFDKPSHAFTDTQMLKKLPIRSLNTIRKIRIDLQNQNIIKSYKQNLPNNQKQYKLFDKIKFIKLFRKYTLLNNQKINAVFTEDSITYFRKFAPFITLRHSTVNHSKINSYKYPVRLYNKGICPVCQGKLGNFKSGKFNLHDKRCSKCRYTFYYGAIIVASKKPIKNKGALNFAPWRSYNNPVRKKAANKLQAKILREMPYSSYG